MGEIARRFDASRVDAILDQLLEGESDGEIERGAEAETPPSEREALFVAVVERLRAAAKCDREAAIGFALSAYRRIYKDAREAGDLAQARGAIKDWVTLALRHNVLDDGEDEEPEADEEVAGEVATQGPPQGDDGEPATQRRRAKATGKPPAPGRADPSVRGPRAPKPPRSR